jgi:hypothetical protein
MGKYKSSSRRELPPNPEGPHVIWRGIGCLMMLIIPAISILAALATIGSSLVIYIPYQLMGLPVLPNYLFATSGLRTIFVPIANTENLYAIIFISLLYMLLISGVIGSIYATVYRFIGPPRYGPLDEPPPKIKTKRYTR